jgi:protein SCO1/2
VTAYVPPLEIGDDVPAIALRDQRNAAVSWATWPGATLVVAFTYTRCRDGDACPLVSAKFAALQSALREKPVHLIEISLDPAHDTPDVLRRYGRGFGVDATRWSLLTGAPDAVDDLRSRFGISRTPERDGSIRHAESVFVIDRDGRLTDRIEGDAWRPGDVGAQVLSDAALASNPFLRLRFTLGRGVGAVCGSGTSGLSIGFALVLFATLLGAGAFFVRRLVRQILAAR